MTGPCIYLAVHRALLYSSYMSNVAMISTETSQQARCQRPGCKGVLRSPESIARGTSKACDRKVRAEKAELIARAKEGFTADQVAKAEAAIANGDVTEEAPGLYAVKSSRSAEKYRSDGLSCVCPAGAHDRRCWHLLAAKIFEILRRPLRPAHPALALLAKAA